MPGGVKKGHNADSVAGADADLDLKSESGELHLFAQSDLSGAPVSKDIITELTGGSIDRVMLCSLAGDRRWGSDFYPDAEENPRWDNPLVLAGYCLITVELVKSVRGV